MRLRAKKVILCTIFLVSIEKKNYASGKKLLTSIKGKGPLGKKGPFTRKEKEARALSTSHT